MELTKQQQLAVCLHGLNAFSFKERETMSENKKYEYASLYKKAQQNLNLFKQEKVIALSNEVFAMFGHSKFAKALMEDKRTYKGFFCNMSFRELGITPQMIEDRLTKAHLIA